MTIPTNDKAFEDEFLEKLLESLKELEASFEKLQNETEPELNEHNEQLKFLEERISNIERKVQRRWREIILTDDQGVQHRIPKLGFLHICLITEELKDEITMKFPVPTTGLPCLRVFSASFPGVCVDFRAEGEMPQELLKKTYKTPHPKGAATEIVLSDEDFLGQLAQKLVEGEGLTLKAGEYGVSGKLSIQVNTYQYMH